MPDEEQQIRKLISTWIAASEAGETGNQVVMTPRGGSAAVRRSGNSLVILQKQSGSWLLLRDANMVTRDP